jgi:uncharacterized protein YacL
MAGLSTHLIIVFVVGISVWIFSKKWYYGAAFGIGHLISDLISFGIPGIKMGSLDPSVIMTHPWFQTLALFSHNAFNWAIIAMGVWLIAVLLYSLKKIERKTFAATILTIIFFIVGVIIHLVVDKLIIETSYWI